MCWNQSAPHCSISYYDQWECYGLLLFVEIRLLGLCSHSRNGMGAAIKSTTMERKPFWWISVGRSEMTNIKTLLSCQSNVYSRRKKYMSTHCYQLVNHGPSVSKPDPKRTLNFCYTLIFLKITVQWRSPEDAKNFHTIWIMSGAALWLRISNMGGIWITLKN